MELNWTTFILELINFVVLIWILNRFLYRPVMNVIAQRKAAIQKTLSEAETTRSEAQVLQSQYENRLTEWEQEREKARAQLRDEISAERNRLLDNLRAELDQEREKAAAVEQRRLKDFAQQAEATAIAQGGAFASRLLSRLGGPELERKIIDMVRQDLPEPAPRSDAGYPGCLGHDRASDENHERLSARQGSAGRALPCLPNVGGPRCRLRVS